jgi:hypothetical protein
MVEHRWMCRYWLSTRGCVDLLLYFISVIFSCNPNCDVNGTGQPHHM